MSTLSKYTILCKVIEAGSFTAAAEQIGYSQSAVSQIVKSLEQELATTLIERRKDGILLTKDGQELFPYIRSISQAEKALQNKYKEMHGLLSSSITIGSFSSISRNVLPSLMQQFKALYPNVNIILRQGDYTEIKNWILNGEVDFGFISSDAAVGIETDILYTDAMVAVLPEDHPLASQEIVTLEELAKEPFILLDEGEYSLPLNAFQAQGLQPHVEYKVYDDFTILAMVKSKLGISIQYSMAIQGYEHNVVTRPVPNIPERKVAVAYTKHESLSLASKTFIKFIRSHCQEIIAGSLEQ